MKIKYKTGSVREVSKAIGMRLIAAGIADAVDAEKTAPTYQTRMMQAEPMAVTVNKPIVSVDHETGVVELEQPAPYGYKADGTPRKRPGRTKASE